MPKFQKDFPKDAWEYFLPGADEDYKRKHPIQYTILMLFGLAGLVLPITLLLLLTLRWYPVPNSGFLMLAVAGAFLIGVGIFNIIAAWVSQYLGHLVTAGCFLIGSCMTAVALVILYSPDVYALFDENVITYYFMSLLFLAVPPAFYGFFRLSVSAWLNRKGMQAHMLQKLKKGKRNYWWYEAVNAECPMGAVYHLNKWFTVLYPVTLVLSLFFGWIKVMLPVISGLYGAVALLLAVMSLFSSVQNNRVIYGKPFVLLRWTKEYQLGSVVLDLMVAALPLFTAYVHIGLMLEVLQ